MAQSTPTHTTYIVTLSPIQYSSLVLFNNVVVKVPPFLSPFVKLNMTFAEAVAAIQKNYPNARISAPMETPQ